MKSINAHFGNNYIITEHHQDNCTKAAGAGCEHYGVLAILTAYLHGQLCLSLTVISHDMECHEIFVQAIMPDL